MPTVTIDASKCTSCGTCVDTCPMSVFAKKKKVTVEKASECVGCRACEVQCPVHCITVKD
jgi:NAD-dependent dihydropyrimidine dehydrogenase PreA subunit